MNRREFIKTLSGFAAASALPLKLPPQEPPQPESCTYAEKVLSYEPIAYLPLVALNNAETMMPKTITVASDGLYYVTGKVLWAGEPEAATVKLHRDGECIALQTYLASQRLMPDAVSQVAAMSDGGEFSLTVDKPVVVTFLDILLLS